MVTWTQTQTDRLKEVEADADDLERSFSDTIERNRQFQKLETQLVEKARRRLQEVPASSSPAGMVPA